MSELTTLQIIELSVTIGLLSCIVIMVVYIDEATAYAVKKGWL